MRKRKWLGMGIAGLLSGMVTGLLGAGGGMILVPALTRLTDLDEKQVFPASVSIILPVCIVSILFHGGGSFPAAFPYLIGSLLGGLAAGFWGRRIPVKWLHRALGLLILWGGVRFLC